MKMRMMLLVLAVLGLALSGCCASGRTDGPLPWDWQ